MTVTYVAKTRVMEIQLTAGFKSTFLTVYLVGLAAERKWRCSSLKCHISVSRYLYLSIGTIDAVLKKIEPIFNFRPNHQYNKQYEVK